ncbi:Ig-like domain-containing protein [Neobacillus niacini]|uniref:Ig-like domain-containing protein n=1 Tax=Neobacillus niacini TaxID=86668 RepID=UPI002864824E|nr:Ig-like domain-containing protein [Neobacillus niacini]MDR7000098.1 Leucine-rich repeat (LRR) protein [Neobacillus niacini]
MKKKVTALITTATLLLTSSYLPAVIAEAATDLGTADSGTTTPENLSQVINIPDTHLREAINISLNKLPYSDVYLSELQGLQSLSLDGKNIKNLEGLQYAVNLQSISLTNNAITDISPLGNLSNLTKLYLAGNQIQDIKPLSNLQNLTDLQLVGNPILDLASLSSLTNLQILNLAAMKITNINSLSSLTNLKQLDISQNSIADVSPLNSLINLNDLNLSYNPLKDVNSISNLTNLERLVLINCGITDLSPIASLTKLRDLSIDSNKITDISPLGNLTNLVWLYLDNNQIIDISPLERLNNLIDLGLDQNQISDISVLADKTIIFRLSLSGNKIEDIQSLQNLTNLEFLQLNWNHIKDIQPLSNLTKLTRLELYANQISDIRPLAKLMNLSSLYLSGNRIADISPLANLSMLETLDIAGNQIIDTSSLNYLKKLRTLYLFRNFIPGKSYQYSFTVPEASREISIVGNHVLKVPVGWLLDGRQIKLPDNDFNNLLSSITLKSKNSHVTASFDETGAILIKGIENGDDEVTVEFSNPELDQTIKIKQVDVDPPAMPTVNPVGDNSISVTGSADAGTEVNVKLGMNRWKSVADEKGNFAVTIPKQKAGTVLEVIAKDTAENESDATNVTVLDQTAPNEPSISNTVSDQTTAISGKTEPFATVKLYISGKYQGDDTADKNGIYRFKFNKQKAGVEIKVTSTDLARNESIARIIRVIDKTPPVVPSVNTISDKSISIYGKTEATANVKLYIAGKYQKSVAADKYGHYKFTISKQRAGTEIKISATDHYRNTSIRILKVLDKTAPSTPTVNKITYKSIYITGKTEKSATVYIYKGKTYLGNAKATTKGSFKVKIKAQKKGTFLKIFAKDMAGNKSNDRTVKVY